MLGSHINSIYFPKYLKMLNTWTLKKIGLHQPGLWKLALLECMKHIRAANPAFQLGHSWSVYSCCTPAILYFRNSIRLTQTSQVPPQPQYISYMSPNQCYSTPSVGLCGCYESYKGNYQMSEAIISLCDLSPCNSFWCLLAVIFLCLCVHVCALGCLRSYRF